MEIKNGRGTTKYGKGVDINLDGNELATAIHLWLYSQGVYISGPSTVSIGGERCREANVYVDPSGFVIHDGIKIDGTGPDKEPDHPEVTLEMLGKFKTFEYSDNEGIRWEYDREDHAWKVKGGKR